MDKLMSKFVIGDEEYTEEVNTSYDQDQEIGDSPNSQFSLGAEPIDAKTGEDFYSIQTGGPKEGLGEFKGVWKELGYEGRNTYHDSDWSKYFFQFIEDGFMGYKKFECVTGDCDNVILDNSTDAIKHLNDVHNITTGYESSYILDTTKANCEDCGGTGVDDGDGCESCDGSGNLNGYENYVSEKLNKDGTGTAVARRGINPNNKKHVVMKFDYVSQSNCKICRPYDGHVWGRDSPNRPVIPRLERVGKSSSRPYTHPNCKCRWIKVFNEVNSNESMKSNERVKYKMNPKHITRARKEFGHDRKFDSLSNIERDMLIIHMLRKDLGMEFIEMVDPMPLATMAKMTFDAIKEPIKTRLKRGEAKVKATEQEGPYGIQPMLDQIVNKSLGKEEKAEIEEEVSKDFTLDNLLQLVADKLAKKAAKKMGLESRRANEDIGDPYNTGDKETDDLVARNDELMLKKDSVGLTSEEEKELNDGIMRFLNGTNYGMGNSIDRTLSDESHKVKANEYHWMDQNNPNRDLSDPTWVSSGASHQMNRERTRRMSDSSGYVCQTCRFKSGDEEEVIKHLTDHPHHIMTKVMGGESHKANEGGWDFDASYKGTLSDFVRNWFRSDESVGDDNLNHIVYNYNHELNDTSTENKVREILEQLYAEGFVKKWKTEGYGISWVNKDWQPMAHFKGAFESYNVDIWRCSICKETFDIGEICKVEDNWEEETENCKEQWKMNHMQHDIDNNLDRVNESRKANEGEVEVIFDVMDTDQWNIGWQIDALRNIIVKDGRKSMELVDTTNGRDFHLGYTFSNMENAKKFVDEVINDTGETAPVTNIQFIGESRVNEGADYGSDLNDEEWKILELYQKGEIDEDDMEEMMRDVAKEGDKTTEFIGGVIDGDYECTECGYKHPLESRVRAHIKQEHNVYESKASESGLTCQDNYTGKHEISDEDVNNTCKWCGQAIEMKTGGWASEAKYDIKCPYCDATFKADNGYHGGWANRLVQGDKLQGHIKKEHNDMYVPYASVGVASESDANQGDARIWWGNVGDDDREYITDRALGYSTSKDWVDFSESERKLLTHDYSSESDGRTDEEQIEYAKQNYGYIPFGEEHPNYKNDPERDSIGQSKNFKRNGDPITKYDWGDTWPHPDYTRDPNSFYEDGTPKTGMSIPELTQQINNLSGGMLNRKRKEDWESYSGEGERFEGNCGICGSLKRDYRYRCGSCGAMGTDAKESIAKEWTTYDEEDYKAISPDVLTDKKKKDEAEELDPNHFKDPETWYNAIQGAEREKIAGGGLSDPYDELPEWNQENIYYAWNAKKDGEQVDRSDWYKDDYYQGESEMESEFDELGTARSIMKKQVDTYNDKPTPEEKYDDPHITMGYNWQKGGEGGKGSGRKDHRPWMLGAEISNICQNCMISTEWEGTICTMCGTDSKTL